ncbi:cell division protein FtsN [Parabacteroides sp. PFB2-12]|uniref:SPOR domain-containing protein n=1 Tax=unclassified Parabacteroides TaxID=2649774 RepID=UPI00247654AF|nr:MULTISPECIES: SPOR domain-containing protein [unclassified Parabacteroides]MDH6343579.1 cell division protein FtsN [Parabacteroides sp. PM6-13]MDH6391440.1 cell division protein FtsN [Parabacteroides sp. PFB2-12]
MKKIWLFGAAICMIVSLGSCKPKQSAYKAAYEQAKEREMDAPTDVVVVNDDVVDVAPVSKPKVAETTRTEKIKPAQGEDPNRLKRFSVVIGSFRNKTNAYSLKERMENDGYYVVLGENDEGMLRVIVSSFDDKTQAAASRDAFKRKYAPNFQDSWLLERTY